MKRWLYIFLLVCLIGCQSAEAIATETAIASTATQVLTSTPTASPSLTSTLTPTPKPCPQINVNLIYGPPEEFKDVTSIESFLNAGGDPKQLAQYYESVIKDLNADTVPEILVQSGSLFKRLLLFSCTNGEYKEQLIREDETDIGLAEQIKIMAIDDLNKNGAPELIYKTLTCLWLRCGELFVIEWDGEKFLPIIKDNKYGETVDYADMSDPQDAYLEDLDNDGIPELIWKGEIPPEWHGDYWVYYPERLATHVYKWDGKNYSALPVTYSPPEFRFQAVQDGDRYTRAGEYPKALNSYDLAISSDSLDWWTEDRRLYNLNQDGFDTCNGSPCPSPSPDPKERPVLSAYASYRIMLIHILTNNLDDADVVYRKLLKDYPEDNPGYPIAEMATLFWNEYQVSKDISKACDASVTFIATYQDVLMSLSGGISLQNIYYLKKTSEVCPFK